MKVVITYANGSTSEHPFKTMSEARDFWRDGISYSGDRVRRVEARSAGLSLAIWDASWDAVSKAAGLSV
jgi:hypothetical protein